MVDWQPTPPIQNSGALVSITHFQAVYCFGTRFAIGPDRADKLAANSRSLLSIRMAEGYWSQVFTEYTVKGLPEVLEEAAATSYEELQEALLALDLDPTQLLITANDWTYADPFDKPAIAARAARGNQPRILARPGVPRQVPKGFDSCTWQGCKTCSAPEKLDHGELLPVLGAPLDLASQMTRDVIQCPPWWLLRMRCVPPWQIVTALLRTVSLR